MHAAAAACTAEIKNRLLNRLQEAGQKTRGSTLISHFGLDAANGVSPALAGAHFTRSPPRPLSANGGRSLRQTGRLLFPVITPISLLLYYHQGPAVSRFFRKLHRPRTFVRVYSSRYTKFSAEPGMGLLFFREFTIMQASANPESPSFLPIALFPSSEHPRGNYVSRRNLHVSECTADPGFYPPERHRIS